MADKIIYVGSKHSIPKRLHDNGDDTYSDTVYIEGVIADLNMDIDAAELATALGVVDGTMQVDVLTAPAVRALTNADVVTAELSAVDNAVLDAIAAALSPEAPLHYSVDFTASQTGETLWTPASGKKFRVEYVVLSFSAAGALTLFDGTDSTANRVLKMNGAVNGGMTGALVFQSSTVDNVLKYTTGAGAAGSLTVFGYEV